MPDDMGSAALLCRLPHVGLIEVSGDDATSFLQNLLSNDIQKVSPQQAQLSSFNTAKGRALASFLVLKQGDCHWLQLPLELVAPIQKKLSMYVLRSKVKLADISSAQARFGVAGEHSDVALRAIWPEVPAAPLGMATNGQAHLIRLGPQHFECICPLAQQEELVQRLGLPLADSHDIWELANIHAGLPTITAATQEAFVLQMINFDVINGVSFKKGCYPGQEVVARMQHLGKPKRRMYLAHVEGISPQAGNELFSPNAENQVCGMVVNAAPAPAGGYDMLAVVQISSRETDAVHLGSLQGPRLHFLPLPYALP